MKKSMLMALSAVVLLGGCETKPAEEKTSSDWDNMELNGRVKRMVYIDHNIVNPEWMALSEEDYDDENLLDYVVNLTGYCVGVGEDPDDYLWTGTTPEDFYYYSPSHPGEGYSEDIEPAYRVYTFDANGDLENESFYMPDELNAPYAQNEYSYDDRHHLLRFNHFDGDQMTYYNEFEYNEAGSTTREYYWVAEGDAFEYCYTYDADNRQIRTEQLCNGKITYSNDMTYTESGKLKSSSSQNNNYADRWKYEYFSSGKMKDMERERRRYDKLGNLEFVAYTTYSDDYSERFETSVDGAGDTIELRYYQLDKRGNVLYEAYYPKGSDLPSSVWRYTFDKSDRQTFYEWEGETEQEYGYGTFVYDAKGREVESTFMYAEDGPIVTRNVSTYTSDDNVATCETFRKVQKRNSDEPIFEEVQTSREEYTYDEKGNWITHKLYYYDIDGEPLLLGMDSRKIEYYED